MNKERIRIVDDESKFQQTLKLESPDKFGNGFAYIYHEEFKKKYFWSKEKWHLISGQGCGTGDFEFMKQLLDAWYIPGMVHGMEVINDSKYFQAYMDNRTLHCGVVGNPHHVYFLSNREIKKGDWVMDRQKKNEIRKSECGGYRSNKTFRIEASTDFQLLKELPTIEQSFVDHFQSVNGNIKSVELKLDNTSILGESDLSVRPLAVMGYEVIVISSKPKIIMNTNRDFASKIMNALLDKKQVEAFKGSITDVLDVIEYEINGHYAKQKEETVVKA